MDRNSLFRALVIEDDATAALCTLEALRACGFSCTWAKSLTEASAFAGQAWHVLFLDLLLPETTHATLSRAVEMARDSFPEAPLIVLSAYLPELKAFDLLRKGADLCVSKPLRPNLVGPLVHRAVCVNRGRLDHILERLDVGYLETALS